MVYSHTSNQYLYNKIVLVNKAMGSCMNQGRKQSTARVSIPMQSKVQKKLQNEVVQPLTSTLYNLLRKSSQIQIFHNSSGSQKLFNKESNPNLAVLSPADIKMLYSFKNLLFIGKNQQAMTKIRQSANPKSMNLITEEQAIKFVKQFPIFSDTTRTFEPKQIPILAINSSQILNSREKKLIFLHSVTHRNQQIYSKLQINQTVDDDGQSSAQKVRQSLLSAHGQRILFLHAPSRSQDDLLDILSGYAVNQFRMTSLGAKIYIRKCLPQTNLNEDLTTHTVVPTRNSSKSIKAQKDQNMALTGIYEKYLHLLHSEMGDGTTAASQVDRAYHLLVTLLSNIYNNKDSDNYRQVKKTNSQINSLLGHYKNGVKLLNQIGFKDNGAFYTNNVDIKYIKIYRTDLDMGYRNYVNSR